MLSTNSFTESLKLSQAKEVQLLSSQWATSSFVSFICSKVELDSSQLDEILYLFLVGFSVGSLPVQRQFNIGSDQLGPGRQPAHAIRLSRLIFRPNRTVCARVYKHCRVLPGCLQVTECRRNVIRRFQRVLHTQCTRIDKSTTRQFFVFRSVLSVALTNAVEKVRRSRELDG